MKQYLDLVKFVMDNGEVRPDRTGTGTKSWFGYMFEHDCRDGFPLMTHKKVGTKSVFSELVWFLAGDTNSHNLEKLGSTIWQEWANAAGDIGPMYGAAWRGRGYHEIDQLAMIIKEIKDSPMSRRLLVSAWLPELLPVSGMSPIDNVNEGNMALAPCHVQYQFYVTTNGVMHLKFDIRSNDLGLGAPFNIASYAALLYLVAYLTDYTPGRLIATIGDAHLYMDHIESGAVDKILAAKTHPLPTMDLSDIDILNVGRDRIRKFDKKTAPHIYGETLDMMFVDNAMQMVDGLRKSVKGYTHEEPIKMNVSV